jgi:RNA polymerase sigma-70 factor (ECF subfamily)
MAVMAIIEAPIDGLLAGEVDLSRDRALVERYQSGDVSAFDELYRRYFDRLVRFCGRRLDNRHEAEEVAQEAFVRALRSLDSFGGDRRFYPWLTVIASRIIIDTSRARGRCEPVGDVDPGATDGGTERVVEMVDYTLLDTALSRLTDRHRDVLELRERQGWSYNEIAQHYAVNQGTVEQLLFRARKALRREFIALGGDGRLAALPAMALLSRRFRTWLSRLDPIAAEAVARIGSSAAGVALVAATATGVAGFVHGHETPATAVTVTRSVAEAVVPAELPAAPVAPTDAAPPRDFGAPRAFDEPADVPPGAQPPVAVTSADDAREAAGPTGAEAPGAAAGGDVTKAAADVTSDVEDYRTFVEERLQ